jgi:hypothetical protein
MGPSTVQIDVWSDYVCPFCYLVEPTLAQIQQDGKGKVRLSWHAFELRPDPVPTLDPNGNYLRDFWERAVYPMAKARGMVLRLPQFGIPAWVKVVCAITLACGTATGGWRVIRTVGHKVVKLHTVEGFVAQSTAASVIQAASLLGIPLSTTHVVTTCIMGVGGTKGLKAIQWTTVESMLWTWILTLPATALLGWGLLYMTRMAAVGQ